MKSDAHWMTKLAWRVLANAIAGGFWFAFVGAVCGGFAGATVEFFADTSFNLNIEGFLSSLASEAVLLSAS